jgi:hypothetical protein
LPDPGRFGDQEAWAFDAVAALAGIDAALEAIQLLGGAGCNERLPRFLVDSLMRPSGGAPWRRLPGLRHEGFVVRA